MSIPRPTLDLEAWNQFLQQEKSNDYQYNLLLYKFKSFLNEVKQYYETHQNCNITRSSNDTTTILNGDDKQQNNQLLQQQDQQQHHQTHHSNPHLHHNHHHDQYLNNNNNIKHQQHNKQLQQTQSQEDDEKEKANQTFHISCSSINSNSSIDKSSILTSSIINQPNSFASRTINPTPPQHLARPSVRNINSTPISEDPSDSHEYSNYVNIDFFLKRRNQSPSFEDVYDNPNEDDEIESSHLIEDNSTTRDIINCENEDGDGEDDNDEIEEDEESLDDEESDDDTTQSSNNNGKAFIAAQNTMRSFLSDLNLSSMDSVFEDKAQRRIVKESFAVEFCGKRKLRHLFLFNDVIVCAKYQASSKQKFTFDVKWYLTLNGVSIIDLDDMNKQIKYDKDLIENCILDTRTNLMILRSQMQQLKRSKHKQPSKIIKKLKKKKTELEAQLVLLLPHLALVIKHVNGKKYTFFMSSNFDRNQWIESIKFLQSQLTSPKSTHLTAPSSTELQAWIQTCRKNLNPTLGTFLLRSNCDDDLLYGDLYLTLIQIDGVPKAGNYHFCYEVDSYGHFFQKASSPVLQLDCTAKSLGEEHIFPLDGAHTLRILMYQDLGNNSKPSLAGKAQVELSHACFLNQPVEKTINFNSSFNLKVRFSYSSSELMSMRIAHTKLCPTFGMDITQVCKKEKTSVPLLIQLCVNEVERRGMRETGIYRMSGTSTDVQKLRKAFETNPYVAELLLRDIDINSVTGFLKTYLREMPEGLFSNKLHARFVAAFNIPQTDSLDRTKKLLELFHKIPIINQNTILFLVEHLVKVNSTLR